MSRFKKPVVADWKSYKKYHGLKSGDPDTYVGDRGEYVIEALHRIYKHLEEAHNYATDDLDIETSQNILNLIHKAMELVEDTILRK